LCSSLDNLEQHGDDSRGPLDRSVLLNRAESFTFHVKPSNGGDSHKYLKAHGSLMVFTWILITSTGILFARYFKKSWPGRAVCGKPIWFSAHRLLMSVAAILTLLGFMFVLVYTGGKWVTDDKVRAHAIIGVIVVGLAFLQPFMALFRCEPDSRYRFIFNYLHALVGFSAWVLSMATLVLATTNFNTIFPTTTGWILMVVWICWMLGICLVFECIQRRTLSTDPLGNKQHSDDNVDITSSPLLINRIDSQSSNRGLELVKNILLVIHICVATGLSAVLVKTILDYK
jgi:Eukaryotic cytochrome b561